MLYLAAVLTFPLRKLQVISQTARYKSSRTWDLEVLTTCCGYIYPNDRLHQPDFWQMTMYESHLDDLKPEQSLKQ